MKILFLITKSDLGGAQKYVQDLAASLPREKFETKIITGGKGGIRHLSNAFRPYFLFLNDIAAVIEIVLYLRKHRPDILHLNSSKAGVVGAIAAKVHNAICHLPFAICRPIRVIFTAHGWVFNPENRYSWLRQRCYILFHKFAALFQDAIINVSEYDRQLALHYHIAPAKKLFTIHNGINTNAINFLDKTAARAALLHRLQPTTYNLQPKYWIASVGRLVVEKNFQVFIDAASRINNDNIAYLIIGNGYERQKLETKIAALHLQDKFFLLDTIPDAAQYLKAFDVFVIPSIKEGLPYTLLEAMAAGLPIIATKTGGIPEILEPQNGLVVPPRNPDALANAIQKLLSNTTLQKTLAANAHAYAERELTLERMTRQTIAVYERPNNR